MDDAVIDPNDGTILRLSPRGTTLFKRCLAFIKELDRSSLGRFAAEAETLLWMDVLNSNYRSLGAEGDRKAINRVINIRLGGVSSKERDKALGESRYWRYLATKGTEDEVKMDYDRWKHLEIVAAYPPEFHDYFAVGIWDIENIRGFITEGVDPELALAVA